MDRREYFRLWLSVKWWNCRDWFARFVHAQHNARVIIDFERRLSSVIYHATGGLMSKAYYREEAMLSLITEQQSRDYDRAYAEGRSDLAAELGVIDPSPVVPE